MSNEYYNANGMPQNSGPGLAIDLRVEHGAISAGFDKLPILTGNQDKLVVVNPAANGLMVAAGKFLMNQSWVPTLSCAVPGDLAVVFSTQVGEWHQLGNLAFLSFELVTSTFTYTTASGGLTIGGLPNTPIGSLPHYGTLLWSGLTKASYTQVRPVAAVSASVLGLEASGSGQPSATVAITDFPTAGTVKLKGSLWYPVAG